jgi:hypothetical protein
MKELKKIRSTPFLGPPKSYTMGTWGCFNRDKVTGGNADDFSSSSGVLSPYLSIK